MARGPRHTAAPTAGTQRLLRRRWLARRLASLLVLAGAVAPLAGWGPATQVAIARTAARLAPPGLAGQLERRADRFREGVLAPFQEGAPERHYRNRDGGALDAAIADEVARAIATLRRPASFDDVVYRLGRVSHFVADANNPLNAAGDDAAEGRYFADWLRYADSARPRFVPVFYLGEPSVGNERGLRFLVLRALQRGRALYPLVGEEYRRIDFGSGAAGFDDRSTAFGIAAVSYSHAISDVARVLHYVWLAGGGGDPRGELWAATPPSAGSAEERLLLLPAGGSR